MLQHKGQLDWLCDTVCVLAAQSWCFGKLWLNRNTFIKRKERANRVSMKSFMFSRENIQRRVSVEGRGEVGKEA